MDEGEKGVGELWTFAFEYFLLEVEFAEFSMFVQ